MKKILVLSIVFVSSLSNAVDSEAGPIRAEKLTLTREKISQVDFPLMLVSPDQLSLENASPITLDDLDPISPLNTIDVAVDKIINIGKKIWAVVEAGKPVVNQTYNVAHALPDQLRWNELELWQPPRAATYRITYKNAYGMTVVDFTYRLSFIYGGSYRGVGKYLTGIRIQPAKLVVAWGYTFDVKAEIPEVYNMGKSEDPVAAANVIINWQVKTSMNVISQSDQYMVNGLGVIQPL